MIRGVPILAIGFVVSGLIGATYADLLNGNFDDGLNGWTVEGDVSIATTAGGESFARFQENGVGARSRIQRTFDLPADPDVLSFRYQLTTSSQERTSKVAPDSFAVFLTAASDPQTRLVVPPSSDPDFSRAYYYADGDGVGLFDSQYVTVTDGPQGAWTTVTLDVSGLAGSLSVHLEFALLTGDNDITTVLAIDDAYTTCPEDRCCDPATGEAQVIDDGDLCTEDFCSNGVRRRPGCQPHFTNRNSITRSCEPVVSRQVPS